MKKGNSPLLSQRKARKEKEGGRKEGVEIAFFFFEPHYLIGKGGGKGEKREIQVVKEELGLRASRLFQLYLFRKGGEGGGKRASEGGRDAPSCKGEETKREDGSEDLQVEKGKRRGNGRNLPCQQFFLTPL